MINGIQGEYYSFSASATGSGTDLIARAETLSEKTDILAKRLEIYSSGSLAFKINNGAESTLFKDGTGYYHLLLTDGDVYAKSLVVTQTTACAVFVSLVY
jgi:hypothetical protein